MAEYIALIRKEHDTDFGVSFPDFPGCVSGGSSMDEALRAAEEALALHIEGMREDGEKVPAPSLLDALIANKENADATAVVVRGPSEKSIRVNITLEEALLDAIDRYVERVNFTGGRSGLIAAATKQFIGGMGGVGTNVPMQGRTFTILLDENVRTHRISHESLKSKLITSEMANVMKRVAGQMHYNLVSHQNLQGCVFTVSQKGGATIIRPAEQQEAEEAVAAYMVPTEGKAPRRDTPKKK